MNKENNDIFQNYFSEENVEYNRLANIALSILDYYDYGTLKADLIKKNTEELFTGVTNLIAQLNNKCEQGKALFDSNNQNNDYFIYTRSLYNLITRLINNQNMQEIIQAIFGEEASKYKI